MDIIKKKEIISTMALEIQRAIGRVIEKEGSQVTYAIVNAALLRVLQDNNRDELKVE